MYCVDHWPSLLRKCTLSIPRFVCLFNRSVRADTLMGPEGTRLKQLPEPGLKSLSFILNDLCSIEIKLDFNGYFKSWILQPQLQLTKYKWQILVFNNTVTSIKIWTIICNQRLFLISYFKRFIKQWMNKLMLEISSVPKQKRPGKVVLKVGSQLHYIIFPTWMVSHHWNSLISRFELI